MKTFKLVSFQLVDDQEKRQSVSLTNGLIINKEDGENNWILEAVIDKKWYDEFHVLLKDKQKGETITLNEQDKQVWAITKEYNNVPTDETNVIDTLSDDAGSLGKKINVFMESINQTISEYLVNFDFFINVMEQYGFALPNAKEMKSFPLLPNASGMFSELYFDIENKLKSKNGLKTKLLDSDTLSIFEKICEMSETEKKISFLNRYCLFKKVRNVDAKKIKIPLPDIPIPIDIPVDVDIPVDDVDDNIPVDDVKPKRKPRAKKEVVILEENPLNSPTLTNIKPKIRHIKKKNDI